MKRHINLVHIKTVHDERKDFNVFIKNAKSVAPTGSGKTIAAEIAMFKVFRDAPLDGKCVYIAHLKALVQERIKDWKDISI